MQPRSDFDLLSAALSVYTRRPPVRTSRRSAFKVLIEPMEPRRLLSATVTTLAVPATALLGQDMTFTATVTSGGAPVTGGTVDLISGGTSTGLTASVGANGVATFTFGSGNALYANTYSLSAMFVGNSTDDASTSATEPLTISLPTFTTSGDGLQVATVTTGSGPGAVAGQTITAQYTGFYTSTGAEFDESSAHSPGTFSYVLDADPEQVITGFDEGTVGIEQGETRVIVIPSDLGYQDGMVRTFVIQDVGSGLSTDTATQLGVGSVPTSATVGQAIATPLVVNVEDAGGTLVSSDSSGVTVAIASGPTGAVLGGTTTVAASSGVASFGDLTFSEAGTYTLTASDGSLSPVTTSAITVTATTDAQLGISLAPATATVGQAIATPVVVNVEDVAGTTVASDASSVTVAIASGPAGAVLGGTTTVTASGGQASFGDLTFSEAGTYTLTATDGSLPAVTTSAITVTPVPSTAVPTLTKVVLPAAAVVGVKFAARVPVVVTNQGTTLSGKVTVNLYAGTGTTLDGSQVLVATAAAKLSLKTGKSHTFSFGFNKLPASLPAGTYSLIAQVIDPSGLTNTVATPQTITLAEPVVLPAVSLGAVTPSTIAAGKIGSLLITVTNNGNVTAGGLDLVLTPSSDGVTPVTGVILATLKSPLKIAAGKSHTFRLRFKVPATLPAGTYFGDVSLTLDNVAASSVGITPFTVGLGG